MFPLIRPLIYAETFDLLTLLSVHPPETHTLAAQLSDSTCKLASPLLSLLTLFVNRVLYEILAIPFY